jgi:Protein of unknown function (DUF2628)
VAKAIVMVKGEDKIEKSGIGFAWFGLLFNFGWLAYHGLWRHAGIILLVSVALSIMFRGTASGPGTIWLIMGLIVGFKGWGWHRDKLIYDGYRASNQ